MDFLKFSLSGLDDFAIYAALSIAFVYVYLIIYMRLTPYDELKLIKEGNSAAALSLDRKSTRLNSSHIQKSRMPSSA